ncbi:MAG: hypothetical protein J5995_10045 [Muribaculaceae bacterium]|nr:hypothetical protein [Muribaculaceae bacterium]
MKRKGAKSDFSEARNEELRKVFFSQENYSTCDAAMKKVISTPASRFWVDPDRARDVMSNIERNPAILDNMKKERARMYRALFRNYSEIRRANPEKSKISCVSTAIFGGAPEFFLSPATAREIIYRR